MKIIKIRKKHLEELKEMGNDINGYSKGIEHLSQIMGKRDRELWDFIRKNYPKSKNDDYDLSYDYDKNIIEMSKKL